MVASKHERSTIVLVHGSWHYGDLFDHVKRHLRRFGYDVHTPTAAGHGPGADPNATQEDAVASIEQYIVDEDLRDFTIVGHSWGGTVLTQVIPRVFDRGIKRAVWHNAFVVEDGKSLLDELSPAFRETLEALKDPATGLVELPLAMWRDGFIQDATADRAAETHALLSPEPFAMWDAVLDQGPFYELVANQQLATSYLAFDQDTLVPWVAQFAPRLGSPRMILEPRGSHEVMFTDPKLLAQKIHEAARP